MTSSHILYIPLILLLGVALGFALARLVASRETVSSAERRLEERERVRRLREELTGSSSAERRDGDG